MNFFNYNLFVKSICTILFILGFQQNGISQKDDTTFVFRAEKMPYLKKCENENNRIAEKCSNQLLLEQIQEKLAIPREACYKGIQGIVVVSFIVNEKGEMEQPQIVKDLKYGCGKATLEALGKIIEEKQEWSTGKNGEEGVKVKMNLPVKFNVFSMRDNCCSSKSNVPPPFDGEPGRCYGRALVKNCSMEWREILCPDKINDSVFKLITSALKEKGYNTSEATHRLDKKFQAALAQFQIDNNLPIGRLDYDTLKALGLQKLIH